MFFLDRVDRVFEDAGPDTGATLHAIGPDDVRVPGRVFT